MCALALPDRKTWPPYLMDAHYFMGQPTEALFVDNKFRGQKKSSELIYIYLAYLQSKGIKNLEVHDDISYKTESLEGKSVYMLTGADYTENFLNHVYDVDKVVKDERDRIAGYFARDNMVK
jgi:hypothetical protein